MRLIAGLWLEKNKKYTMDDIAIVYAWNEYGEGAYIAPTVGDPRCKIFTVNKRCR